MMPCEEVVSVSVSLRQLLESESSFLWRAQFEVFLGFSRLFDARAFGIIWSIFEDVELFMYIQPIPVTGFDSRNNAQFASN